MGPRLTRHVAALFAALFAGCLYGAAPDPCGQDDASACISRASVLLAAGKATEGVALMEDACKRMGEASACGSAARALVSGDSARDGDAGPGEASPFGRAVSDWDAGCRLGDGQACWELGRLSMTGKGMPKDQAMARSRYDEGCKHGWAESCVDAGLIRERAKEDLPRALELWKRACELGDGRGCAKVGLAAKYGTAGPVDLVAALKSYEEACAKGYFGGCGFAAFVYEKGEGVPADSAKRLQMLLAGAKLRDPLAVELLTKGRAAGTFPDEQVKSVLDAVATVSDTKCKGGDGNACLVAGLVAQDAALPAPQVASFYKGACEHDAREGCGRLAKMIRAHQVDASGFTRPAELEAAGCMAHWAPACLDWGRTAESGVETEGPQKQAAASAYGAACQGGIQEACEALKRF